MIHTFQLYVDLQPENIGICSNILNNEILNFGNELSNKVDGITVTIYEQFFQWRLYMFVDAIKLLKKPNIYEEDYHTVQDIIDKFAMTYFGEIFDFTLLRIEYRFDAKLPKTDRDFLLRRYDKTLDKYYFSKKKTYDTTIYHSNKSKANIVYDKEAERNDKNQHIEAYEEDILRFEAKLLRSHLYNQKYSNNIKRTLANYWKKDKYLEYMNKNLKPIYFKGDYYKLYDIKKILSKSNLNNKDISGIKEFLIYISQYGVTRAREKYSAYYFRKYIKILESLNINPIIIPKNELNLSNNNFLENPLSSILK